jgi:hypothetical protein
MDVLHHHHPQEEAREVVSAQKAIAGAGVPDLCNFNPAVRPIHYHLFLPPPSYEVFKTLPSTSTWIHTRKGSTISCHGFITEYGFRTRKCRMVYMEMATRTSETATTKKCQWCRIIICYLSSSDTRSTPTYYRTCRSPYFIYFDHTNHLNLHHFLGPLKKQLENNGV